MKRIYKTILAFLLAIAGVSGCILLYRYTMDNATPKQIAGYLDPGNDELFVRESLLKSLLEEQGITLLTRENGETDAQAIQRMADAGARAIIVGESTPNGGLNMTNQLDEDALTLLFVGNHPHQTVLSESDKAWYLGSDSAHGGEMLGTEIANRFKSGEIEDRNQDLLLQVMVVGKSDMIDHALAECEHLGVYTEVLSYVDSDEKPLPFTAEGYADAPMPEFILCDYASDARSAHELAQQLGWIEGENPIQIGCSAGSKEDAQSLLKDGIVSLPVPYYDVDEVTRNAAAFIQNVLDFKFVSQGTDLSPNREDRFMVPYQIQE